MAGKIYNDRGQVIGTYKTEKEINEGEEFGCMMMLGWILFAILAGLVLFPILITCGSWISLGVLAYTEPTLGIPAFVVVGGLSIWSVIKTKSSLPINNNTKWPWIVYWLELSIKSALPGLIAALLIGGVSYGLIEYDIYISSYFDEEEVFGLVMAGVGCTILPAAIVAVSMRRKGNKSTESSAGNIYEQFDYSATPVYCPICGSENNEGAYACSTCGSLIKDSGGIVSVQENVCAICGSDLDYVTGACPYCSATEQKTTTQGAQRSKTVACVLAFVGGSLGMHDFYLGNVKFGLAKIVISVLGYFWYGVGYISTVWAWVDFFRLLLGAVNTDAKGEKLRK